MRNSVEFRLHPNQDLVPAWCHWRFDMNPNTFRDYRFWQKVGQTEVWIAPRENEPFVLGCLVSFGMMVMRRDPPRGKPTSIFLQRFGAHARRNIIDLNRGQLADYVRRKAIQIEQPDLSDGDCIVTYGRQILGCARYADGHLNNAWPKHVTSVLPDRSPIL
ncbi:MAG: hypothetical protein VYA30_15360 [Myxococcota bacterium]|nr:hypothetical protein [Myxococcota bacterium]